MPEKFDAITIEDLIDTTYGAIANFVNPASKKRKGELINYIIPSIPLTRDDTFFMDGEIPADGPERSDAFTKKRKSAYDFATLLDFVPSTSKTVLVNDGDSKSADGKVFTSFDEFRTKGFKVSQACEIAINSSRVYNRKRTPEEQERIDKLNALLTVPDVVEEDVEADPSLAEPADDNDLDYLDGLDGLDDLDDLDEEDFLVDGDAPKPTKLFQRYQLFQNRFETAEMAMVQNLIEIDNDPKNARFRAKLIAMERKKLRRKLKQWRTLGKKNQVERIQNIIAALESGGMVEYRDKLQEKMENLSFDVNLIANSGDKAYYTSLVPAGFMQAKWTEVILSNDSKNNHFKSKDTSFSGKTGFSIGFLKVGGSAGYTKNTKITEESSDNLEISFEITQAIISRPWMPLPFLTSRNWTLEDPITGETLVDYEDFSLSDGKPNPTGAMPAYTTSIILVRNVKIKSASMSTFANEVEKSLRAKAKASYFGFGVSGEYSSDTAESTVKFDESTGTLTMLGTHIVAFRGAYLGKAPNPNFENRNNPEDWV